MREIRLGPLRGAPALDLFVLAVGGLATVAASYLAVRNGAQISIGALAAILLFVVSVIGFAAFPYVAVPATIALFGVVPLLKIFVLPEIGGIKDLVVVAAVVAALIVFLFERREPDHLVLALVLLLLLTYVLNVGGSHDVPWLQGIRLTSEPFLLLLVGMVLPHPRRTFRYSMYALIAICCAIAAYGLFQQVVGKWNLVAWGYSFELQVRSLASGQLRSFGTLDDPFAYAAMLTFALPAIALCMKRGPLAWAAALLVSAGLLASFVRTAALIIVAFVAIWLRRSGFRVAATVVVVATIGIGVIALVNASGSQQNVYSVSQRSGATFDVLLNGRISAWEAALGEDQSDWLFGRGVGEIGTAAARAGFSITPSSAGEPQKLSQAVDSGYLATIADVGLAGFVMLIMLIARILILATGAARRGIDAGWMAISLMAALMIDALTRASFTGFPTAFLGLLLVGICLAAAADEEPAERIWQPRPPRL